jgi:hypothetical protein
MPTKSSRSKSASKSRAASTKSRSKVGSKASSSRRGTGRRELVSPNGDKRYVRRSAAGRFKESDDVGRSLATDRRRHAKTKAKPGQGDRGDR